MDERYQHTVLFASASAQLSYFTSKVKHTLPAESYQRVNRGTIRVPLAADSVYDCNYLFFQNTSFGSKYFYAFIDRVEYINNATAEISYTIDVMQTWLFDLTPQACFVEREMIYKDSIGNNLQPEPVELGEYIYNNYGRLSDVSTPITGDLSEMCVIIGIVDTNDTVDGQLYDGIYGAATLWAYLATDVQGINNKCAEYVQNFDAILSMYMVPKALIGTIPSNHRLVYGASGVSYNYVMDALENTDLLNGYAPNNLKLLTYPYTYLSIDNASGQSLALRYEFFNQGKPRLRVGGCITQPVQVTCRPYGYKGTYPGDQLAPGVTLNSETLSLANYPICSWNVDAYEAWVAQNSVPLVLNAATQAGQVGIGAAVSAQPQAAAGMGIIGTITNVISQWYRASIAADVARGNFNNGSGNVSQGVQNFWQGRVSICAEYAQKIDNFFDMFGYATNRVKIPNRNSRPHWNYVKTAGALLTGQAPAEDIRRVAECYDRGITFWKNAAEVGDYTLNNKDWLSV